MSAIESKSKPQIDYHTWKMREAEREEALETQRLMRLYLKEPEAGPSDDERECLCQFCEAVFHGYTSNLKINSAVPDAMQSTLRRLMSGFDHSAALSLAEAADSDDAADGVPDSLLHSASRLSNLLRKADNDFQSYLELSACEGYSKYYYYGEQGEKTCTRCRALFGRVFTLKEVANLNIIPPLHPNCKCKLIAIDAAAEYVYNADKGTFRLLLDRIVDEAKLSEGGVYILSHDFLSGMSGQKLRALALNAYPTITDGENSGAKWYDGIVEWAKRFVGDLSEFLDAFFERGEQLAVNADEMMGENPLLGLLSWADALTLGIVSGLYENFQRNYEIYREAPDVYNFLNLYSHGLVEMITGAFFPEEFMSFRHVLDLTGTASALYAVARAVQSRGAGGLDNAGREAAGAVEDSLDDIARQNGKVTQVLSADELNAAQVKVGYEPSYTPGTKVYRLIYDGDNNFVRVYGGNSLKSGRWFMSADDIAGLSAEQIRDKFSLPQTPTHICDVNIPQGVKIEISVAGRALEGSGGGIQYRFIENYNKLWFTNSRKIN